MFFNLPKISLQVAQKNLIVQLTVAIDPTIENSFVTLEEILVSAQMFSNNA